MVKTIKEATDIELKAEVFDTQQIIAMANKKLEIIFNELNERAKVQTTSAETTKEEAK